MLSAKSRISLIILTVSFWGYPWLCQSAGHAPDRIPQYTSGGSNADVTSTTQDYHNNAGASKRPGPPLHAVDENVEHADFNKQEESVQGLDDDDDMEDVEGLDDDMVMNGDEEPDRLKEDTKEPDKQKRHAEGLDSRQDKEKNEEFAEEMMPTEEMLNKKGETQGVNWKERFVSEMETTARSSRRVHTSPQETSIDGSSVDELEDRTRAVEKEQSSRVGQEKGTALFMKEAKGIPPKERVALAARPRPANKAGLGKERLRGGEAPNPSSGKKRKVNPQMPGLHQMEPVPSDRNSAFDLRLQEGESETWTPPPVALDDTERQRIKKPLKDKVKAYVPNAAKSSELISASAGLAVSGANAARSTSSLLYPILKRGGGHLFTVVVSPKTAQTISLVKELLKLGGKASAHIGRIRARA